MSLKGTEYRKGDGMIKRVLILLVLFLVSCGGGDFPVDEAVGIYKPVLENELILLVYLDYSYKPGYRQSEENRLDEEDGKFMIVHPVDFQGWHNTRIFRSFGNWDIKENELILTFSKNNSLELPAGDKWYFSIDTEGFVNGDDFFKKIKDGADVQRSDW